jgi:ribosomal protein S18 acetylase RimI-like enzyme
MKSQLRPYDNNADRAQVIALWTEVFSYPAEHNSPPMVIAQKLQTRDGLFFVACQGTRIVGTVMAGYDGHRGWMYCLAVHPSARKRGLGTALVNHAENALGQLGCLKVNLQIVQGNNSVAAFYEGRGYVVEPRISMGKRLPNI